MEEDKERVQITFKYVMKTIGWVLFIGLALNRLGMLLTSPVYVCTRNLYYTFPIYLYLLVPVFLGTIIVLFDLEILNKKKTFILGLVAIGLNVAFFTYTVIKGLGDTSFISSISQLYPIDRMASMPVEILIHFLAFLGVGIAILLISRKEKQK